MSPEKSRWASAAEGGGTGSGGAGARESRDSSHAMSTAKVGRVGSGQRGVRPKGGGRDHAVVQGAPAAAAEVEQLGRGGGVHGEERHRLIHDPSGELDRVALDRPTQELGPAHCATAHGLASNQPLAQPLVFG